MNRPLLGFYMFQKKDLVEVSMVQTKSIVCDITINANLLALSNKQILFTTVYNAVCILCYFCFVSFVLLTVS